MAIAIQEKVLGLQVPVHHRQRVEIVKSRDNLGRVEEGGCRVEPTSTSQVGEELAATDVGEEHVEEALVFAAPGQVDQEGMIDLLEDVFPILDMFYLLEPDDIVDGEDFESEVLATGTVATQAHTGEGASTDGLDHVEVVQLGVVQPPGGGQHR